MTTKRLRLVKIAENLVIITGLTAIISTGIILILKEYSLITF